MEQLLGVMEQCVWVWGVCYVWTPTCSIEISHLNSVLTKARQSKVNSYFWRDKRSSMQVWESFLLCATSPSCLPWYTSLQGMVYHWFWVWRVCHVVPTGKCLQVHSVEDQVNMRDTTLLATGSSLLVLVDPGTGWGKNEKDQRNFISLLPQWTLGLVRYYVRKGAAVG